MTRCGRFGCAAGNWVKAANSRTMLSGPSADNRSSWAERDCSARWSVRLMISPLGRSIDGAVRFVDKTLQAFGMPMVAARLPLVAIHALLNDRPFAFVGYEEAMQIKVKAVLYRGAVDFGHEPACQRQGRSVNTDAFAECCQFLRGAARVLAAATADMNAKLALQRGEPALQRADDARGDT